MALGGGTASTSQPGRNITRRQSRSVARADRLAAEAIRVKGRAMLAVRYLGEEIAARLATGDGSSRARRRGIDRVVDQAAAIACLRAGISVAEYRKVHRHDLQIARAQRRVIDHASLGP